MRKKYIIYKLTNSIGQIYVGQTRNFIKRIDNYKSLTCKGQQLIYASLLRYGFDNHTIEILEESDIDNLDELEIYYIGKEDSYYWNNKEFGLNLTLGGNSKRGCKSSEETKLKMSFTRKDLIRKGIIIIRHYPVLQFDKFGNLVKEWNSIKDVSLFVGRSHSTVGEILRSGRDYLNNGYIYSLKKNVNKN